MPPDAPLGDQRTMAWMGTTITSGAAGESSPTPGMRTQIGLIATMLQEETDEETPLQKKLSQVGRWLGIGALAVCAVVFLVGMLEGRDILMMFMTAVSLAIAAVPEGLPAIVTVCLALGMQEMIRRHALIRRLPPVETLGSATTICTDKTGTLTQNEMTAACVFADGELFSISGEGWQPRGEVRRATARGIARIRIGAPSPPGGHARQRRSPRSRSDDGRGGGAGLSHGRGSDRRGARRGGRKSRSPPRSGGSGLPACCRNPLRRRAQAHEHHPSRSCHAGNRRDVAAVDAKRRSSCS